MGRRLLKVLGLVWLCAAAAARAEDPPAPLTLWYTRPAATWVEALPVGNGRLGAMIYGGAGRDALQFNEDTLWTGRPHEYQHPGAARHLAEVRRLLFEGKQAEAERLALAQMMSVPLRQNAYQPFGTLHLEFPRHDGATAYRRELDLDSALATVRYRVGGAEFVREVFSSFPDQVLVVRISSSEAGRLRFAVRISSPHGGAAAAALGRDSLALRGQVEEGGLRFEARVRVLVEK